MRFSAARKDFGESRSCELLITLGEQQCKTGEVDAAEDSLREAAASAERAHDSASLTRVVLAFPSWHWPGPGEANPLALLLAQRCLVMERDRGRRATLMARLAAELSYDPRRQSYVSELASAAMEQVRECSDRGSELYVRLYRDQLLRHPQHLSERLANAEEISRLAIETGDYSACFIAALGKASALSTLGDAAAAGHAAEFAVGIVSTSEVRFHQELPTVYRVYRGVMDGRFEDAAEHFDRCRALANDHKLPYLFDVCWPTMLMPYGEQDRLLELVPAADDTVRRRPNSFVYSALLSWLKVQVGCFADAAFLLERLSADKFTTLLNSGESLAGMCFLAEVCAALRRADCAEILLDRLLPYSDFNVTLNAFSAFGSVRRYVGLLAATLGRKDQAVEHFQKALQFDRQSGARPWAFYSGLALASSLAVRGMPEDHTRAFELLDQLNAEATELKMFRALQKLNEIRAQLSPDGIASREGEVTACLIDNATPRQNMECWRSAKPAPSSESEESGALLDCSASSTTPIAEPIALFCRNADYWQVGRQGRTANLSHRRGLDLIACLLRYPNREFSVLELAHESAADTCASVVDREGRADAAAPVLDGEAKRAYRERLAEIRIELEELRAANNLGGVDKLLEEQDFLTRELARAMGLFGRDRKFGSESERARKRVSIAITRAIRLISIHDHDLATHLKRSIKTGHFCCYTTDPEFSIEWVLDLP